MLQNIVGGEFGSHKVMLSSLQRSKIEAIGNEASNIEIPAMVGFTEKERNFSEQCLVKLKRNFKTSVVQLINLVGEYSEKDKQFQYVSGLEKNAKNDFFQFQNLSPYMQEEYQKLIDSIQESDKEALFNNNNQGLNIIQIIAGYIGYLDQLIYKKQVSNKSQQQSQQPIKHNFYSIFSVPSYFTPVQKKILQQAFGIVKFPLAKVIDEHYAIATSYLYQKKKDLAEDQINNNANNKMILFIDIGYSKSNFFVSSFQKDQAQIQFVNCVKGLGLRTVDQILYKRIAQICQEKIGNFPFNNKKVQLRIYDAIEKHRKILSSNIETDISIECLYDDEDFSYVLTRKEFEELIENDFLNIVKQELQDLEKFTRKRKLNITDIEIMGGGARIPSVKKMIQDTFKVDKLGVSMSVEAISRGCTIQCAQYASVFNPLVKVDNYSVSNCSVYNFSIETIVNGQTVKEDVIKRQQTLPFSMKQNIDLLKYDHKGNDDQNQEILLKLYLENNNENTGKVLQNTISLKINRQNSVVNKNNNDNLQQQQNQPQENKMEEEQNNENKMEEEPQDDNNNNDINTQVEVEEEFEIEKQQNRQINFEINYTFNDDQMLEVRSAQEQFTYQNSKNQNIEIKTPYIAENVFAGEYSRQEMEVFQQIEILQKKIDHEVVELNDIRNTFENNVYDLKRTLNEELKIVLSTEEVEKLNLQLQEYQSWFEVNAYSTAIDNLLQTFKEKYASLNTLFQPYVDMLKVNDSLTEEVKNSDQLKKMKGKTINGLSLNLRNQAVGDGNGFFGFFKKGASLIADQLKDISVHQKIELDLGNSQISDNGVKLIMNSCVQNYKNLKEIAIDLESTPDSKFKNNLTVECLSNVNTFLQSQNESIEKCVLCFRTLYDNEFQELAEVLYSMKKLKFLRLEVKRGNISFDVRANFNTRMKSIMKFNFTYFNENGVKE